MAQSLAVLLIDDGELDDVQSMLEEMQVAWGRLRGSSIVPGKQPRSAVLVTTPRHIHIAADEKLDEDGTVRVVVVNEDSPGMRKQLREIGFDYLVRRPVHPEALRLLILHCLYTGEERRAEPRCPLGVPTTFKAGLLTRKATLADLSTRGCRLFSSSALQPGKRIRIRIPESLGATEKMTVRGQVLRMHLDERIGPDGMYSAAIVFEKLPAKTRQEIEWILEEMANGPPPLDGGSRVVQTAEPTAGAVESPAASEREEAEQWPREVFSAKPDPRTEAAWPHETVSPSRPPDPREELAIEGLAEAGPEESPEEQAAADRRKHPRRTFEAKVPAFGSRALRVLVGRDLSIGGMCVEYTPDLAVGDRLHLAIYGDPEAEPFLVWATVSRDDSEGGMALVFDEVHPVVGEQLEELVMSLPAVENLQGGEVAAMGTVVTEILER